MKYIEWLNKNTESLRGKTVAVTGTTGGIGRELCTYLAHLGASLILMDRNKARSESFGGELSERFPDVEIKYIGVDLADMSSVKVATEQLLAENPDIFIHNAGAYSIPRCTCDTGYDNVFQINFVSPYYMIRSLLPRLRLCGGRVAVVGSIAHNYSRTDRNDIDFSTRSKASLVYGNAKRYLMFSLLRLFENEDCVKLSVTHPGITFTNITAHYPKLIFAIIKHPMKVIFMKPKKAALSVLFGIFATPSAKEREWIGPRIFDVWGLPRIKKLKTATEEEISYIFDTAEGIYKTLCESC